MPRPASRSIRAPTSAWDSRTPRSSARFELPSRSPNSTSYHARIIMPLLIVTGRTGACGKTNRIAGAPSRSSSFTIGTKSLPSAPRPCSQMTLAAGLFPVSISMVSSRPVMSAPAGLAHVRVEAVDVGLHLLARALVDDLAPHDAAGVGEAVARRGQRALHAVHAFADHHLDHVRTLVEYHHVHGLASFGHAHRNFFRVHGFSSSAGSRISGGTPLPLLRSSRYTARRSGRCNRAPRRRCR